MRFFKLTHPQYLTDRDDERANPVVSTVSHMIPGILCEVRGSWSSGSRLRVPLPSDATEFCGVTLLSPDAWMNSRQRWAAVIGVEAELIEPGAKLGPPSGECTGVVTEDVVHPIPGEIWVSARVRDALVPKGFTGLSFAPVQLSPECGGADLSELVVHGRAWRHGSTEESIRLCDICGREGFASPGYLVVDEGRWDGADFVFLDGNPNIVVVTERVAELFDAHGFTNVVAEPIGPAASTTPL